MGSNGFEIVKELLEEIFEILRLKRIYRTGWGYYGYGPPESVAAHTFGVASLTLLIGSYLKNRGEKLDLEKALKMAVIHDFGEARLGDLHLEARKLLGKENVKKAERAAIQKVLKNEELLEIWEEFEKGESREAKFVRAMDKLELLMEAFERGKDVKSRVMDIFNTLENREFTNNFEILKQILAELEASLG